MPQILLCCVLALLLAALGLLLRSLRRRSRPSGGNETLKVLLVCFFTCGILLHLPMYAAAYAGEHLSWLKALLGAVHHTLRMFVLDGELDPIHEFAMSRPAVWSDLYFGAAIVVYLVSPLLTFSVVLSFFKNLSALWRYAFRRCTELYVFSELNEDSLYLAGSIKAAHPKGLIVFTDVYENESEEFGEQMAAAHRLGAACFKADIALLRLRRSDRSRPVYFFLLGRDKAENIHQAVLLTRRWGTAPICISISSPPAPRVSCCSSPPIPTGCGSAGSTRCAHWCSCCCISRGRSSSRRRLLCRRAGIRSRRCCWAWASTARRC